MTKNITCFVFLLFAFLSYAQSNLNDYKYIIVPNSYEFLNKPDDYRLNWLTKSLFQGLKFKAFMQENTLPEDLKNNGCLALKANVLNESNLFKTKFIIQLKNCNDQIIYTSPEGTSRKKDYKNAYHEALRNAFKFLELENYSYTPNKDVLVIAATTSKVDDVKEIEKLKEEIEVLKTKKNSESPLIKQPIKIDKSIENKSAVKPQPKIINQTKNSKTLIAELIPGSLNYLIKNSKNTLIFTLLYSGKQDLYIVKGEDALVYKMNNTWVIAQYQANELKILGIDIKF